jgi:mRNA interferase MazF
MNRGEIWQVALDPTLGAEIGKSRPAVIVSRASVGVLPLRVVVPLTSWQAQFADFPWMVRLDPSSTNGLTRRSAADTFQVKSVAVERLRSRLGVLSDAELTPIIRAVGRVIGHP